MYCPSGPSSWSVASSASKPSVNSDPPHQDPLAAALHPVQRQSQWRDITTSILHPWRNNHHIKNRLDCRRHAGHPPNYSDSDIRRTIPVARHPPSLPMVICTLVEPIGPTVLHQHIHVTDIRSAPRHKSGIDVSGHFRCRERVIALPGRLTGGGKRCCSGRAFESRLPHERQSQVQ